MKAFSIKNYGSPTEVLKLVEIDRPKALKNEVVIKVCATTINDYDWCLSTGNPYAYRLQFGIFKPRKKLMTPGMEVAGIVEEIGENVSKFKVGDAVYGDISEYGFGSFAEFLSIDEKALEIKPETISFEDAASIPHAAMLSVQSLIDLGKIKDNQKILINGGGGGVGSFGIQIAKTFNTQVTGVDSGDKLKSMLNLGFDKVIDYKKEDFTKSNQKYDIILDCKTNRSIWKFLKVLEPGGKYISIGGKSGKLLQMLYLKPILKLFSNKSVAMVMLKGNKDLDYIHQLYKDNKLKCVIDGPYTFDKIPWAIQRFGEGLHTGKIVISIAK